MIEISYNQIDEVIYFLVTILIEVYPNFVDVSWKYNGGINFLLKDLHGT
jgi:hypothetical protein